MLEREKQRNTWKHPEHQGFKKAAEKFQTSDLVIQLAKEECICRVVLNPTDDQSLSQLQNTNIFNLPSNFDNLKLFQIIELGTSNPVWRLGYKSILLSVLTKALILGGAGCEPVIALTGVAPQGVEAAPVLTDPRLGLTFILICAVSLKPREKEESSDHIVQRWIVSFFFFKFSL